MKTCITVESSHARQIPRRKQHQGYPIGDLSSAGKTHISVSWKYFCQMSAKFKCRLIFATNRSLNSWECSASERSVNLISCPNVHTFQELVLQRSPRLESESYQRATGAEKVGRDGKRVLASQRTVTAAEQPHDCGRSAPVAILSGLLSVQDDVRWRQLFVLERPLVPQLTTWLVVAWWNPIRQGAGLNQTRVLAHVPRRSRMHNLSVWTPLCDITIKSSFVLYATGSVALLVNIAVAVFIVLHKSLRNYLAICLLLNVAVCDALIALVSILFARFNYTEMYIKHLLDQLQGKDNDNDAFENQRSKLANIMGPILTCAVTSHVFGSGISMLNKFFKIVFAMKPDVRLGRKTAVVLLVFSWSLSATFAVLPVFGIGRMTYDSLTPLPTDTTDDRMKQRIGFAFGSQIALVIFQLASFLLYVPIFIVAKQSGTNVGVKREAAIARKIALLLCTNFIFFTIPVVVGVSQREIWREVFLNSVLGDWRNRAIAEVQWTFFLIEIFPVLCLSINSLVNPFLYALRQPFKQQLNPLLSRCSAATRECFGNLRQNLRCHTAIEEPINNEVEMQEGKIPQGASLAEGGNDEVQIQPIHLQCPSHASELNCEV